MNKINYANEMNDIIANLNNRPKLWLHSCCAPCSTAAIAALERYFDIAVVYYNPNIDSAEEYVLRATEQKRFLEEYPSVSKIEFLNYGHCKDDFLPVCRGRENLPEGGARCADCYKLRLEKAAQNCDSDDYFATTLTLSPLKNPDIINNIGLELAKKYGVNYLPSDFKKQDGYLKSLRLSEEYRLYRQNYCGCVFSKSNGVSK